MPKISVIIPVYNVKQYIRKSVDSVLKQTFRDLELILVDDGSTDGSEAICDEYEAAEARVRVIHKQNGGLSSARNAGVKIASGEYVGYVDSDDYIEPSMYQLLLGMAEKGAADVAVCGVYDAYKNRIVPQCATQETFTCNGKEMFRQILLGEKISGTVCNKLIKMDIAKKLSFPEGKLFEDAFYSVQLVQEVKCAAVTTKPMYYYVHRSDSITTCAYRSGDMDVIEAFELCEKIAREKYRGLEPEAKFALESAYLRVFDKMLITKGYKKIPEYKRVFEYLRKNASDIVSSPYFLTSRKIAIRAFQVHVFFYRFLLILNEKINRGHL